MAVRVTPRARRTSIDGLAAEADGAAVLRLSVTAPPDGGRANAAVVALLAKTWRVPKRAITVRSGAASRRKVLAIEGDPVVLKQRIEESVRELADK